VTGPLSSDDLKLARDIWYAFLDFLGDRRWCFRSEYLWLIREHWLTVSARWYAPVLPLSSTKPVINTVDGPVELRVIPDGAEPPEFIQRSGSW